MRSRRTRPTASLALAFGMLIGLAGSYADNLLGDGLVVTAAQVYLWAVGGLLLLTGVATSFTLGAGLRAERAHERRDPVRATAR